MAKGRNQGRSRSARHTHDISAAPGSGLRAPGSEAPSTSRARPASYWAIAIGLLAAIVYLNALGNEFVLDDTRLIRDNVRIRSLANIPHLFASSYWDLEGTQGLYRPLVLVTYAVNYAVHGLWTPGYTAVNIVLHAAVSLLLFALVRGIGGSLFAAGAAAAVFAVHPVHTEAVTGMAGRTELLAACFFLIAALLHRMAPGTRRHAIPYRAATAAAFAGALLSKESAITLLLVLPVLDALFPVTRRDGQPAALRDRIVTDYLPLVAVAILYLAVRRAVLGGIAIAEGAIAPLDNPMVPMTTMALGERMGAMGGQALMTAFAVIAEYARLLVWPRASRRTPPHNQIAARDQCAAMAGSSWAWLLVVACLVGIVVLWRRSPVAAFGLAFLAADLLDREQLRRHDRDHLRGAPHVSAECRRSSSAAAVGAERADQAPASSAGAIVVARRADPARAAARTWTRNRDWKNELAALVGGRRGRAASARVQAEGRTASSWSSRRTRRRPAGPRRPSSAYAAAQTHFETALKSTRRIRRRWMGSRRSSSLSALRRSARAVRKGREGLARELRQRDELGGAAVGSVAAQTANASALRARGKESRKPTSWPGRRTPASARRSRRLNRPSRCIRPTPTRI